MMPMRKSTYEAVVSSRRTWLLLVTKPMKLLSSRLLSLRMSAGECGSME